MADLSVLDYFFWLLMIIALVMEVWALVDGLTTPEAAYAAASKLTKKLWLIILVVAAVVGAAYTVAPLAWGGKPTMLLLGILPVAAFIASAVYLADVKPAVAPFKKKGRGGGRSNMGPYGPW
ncbi:MULTISPECIES: DUF2516 family protein [Actinomadura]|uniref:DUF2516 family protein n=1 Tax=Actinomadura yumaensis TaxID=111807 RepID=A0ABW2CH58_9ACTN|nr:DUF2516 family protein [Actinomadura sp. J1-007]